MATAAANIFVGKDLHEAGKEVNVYDTYAHALSFGATGLATIYDITKSTGAQGSAVSQTAKTAGLTVDVNGFVHFYVEAGTVYLMANADQRVPQKVIVA